MEKAGKRNTAGNRQKKDFQQWLLFGCLFFAGAFVSCRAEQTEDERILSDILQRSQYNEWRGLAYVDSLAAYFLNTPYVAATLESEDGSENLVINLRELDCMTFVENVVALYRLLQERDEYKYCEAKCLKRFPEILEQLRYRQGQRENYTSRLHYTSEWILDNEQKGFIKRETSNYCDSVYTVRLNFMSENAHLYKALQAHPEYIPVIAEIEKTMNDVQMAYIPKESLHLYAGQIPSGQVIAIVGSTPGLDFAHLGFTCKVGEKLHMLHASSSGKKVMITPQPLSDYLNDIKRFKGIVLLEVLP